MSRGRNVGRRSSTPKVKKVHLQSSVRRSTALTLMRVIRYGVRNFARNAWLTVAATAVMVITLLIMFGTGVISSVMNETIKIQKSKIDLSYYIKSSVSDADLVKLSDKLRKQPNVTDVSYSTSEQEYKKATSVPSTEGDSAVSIKKAYQIVAEEGTHPDFAAVIHVKLDDMEKRSELDKYIANDTDFKKSIDTTQTKSEANSTKENTINKMAQFVSNASKIGVVLTVVFMVVSILIIFNTIRMTIFSRREEIAMMKSIGADSYFIRGPFLVEAEMYGVLSAVIAFIIGYFTESSILGGQVQVGRLNSSIEGASVTAGLINDYWFGILILMIVIGVAIGDLSARLALRRYLKHTRH